MRDAFAKLLGTFLGVKASTPYATHPELWGVMDRVMFGIKAMPAYKARPYLKYSWSLGAGNWANIPWIAFLDNRETTSTEQGVYCVLLFREDMSGFYLCLSQGVTRLSRELGRAEAYRELDRRAEALRPLLAGLQDHGFVVGRGIDLHATGTLGKGYEQATIAYKLYSAGSLPTDDEFTADVARLLDSYDEATALSRNSREQQEETSGSRVWVYAPGDRAASGTTSMTRGSWRSAGTSSATLANTPLSPIISPLMLRSIRRMRNRETIQKRPSISRMRSSREIGSLSDVEFMKWSATVSSMGHTSTAVTEPLSDTFTR
jgi:hypothetical protein